MGHVRHGTPRQRRLSQQQQSDPLAVWRLRGDLSASASSIAEQPCNRDSVRFRKLRFDLICAANEIEPPLTKPLHPVGQRSGREDKSHDPG